jgi:transposase
MSKKRRRSQRQTIDLEQLKNDPHSFLSWGIEDPTLYKLETYRLYRAGFAVADIADAFGFARGYLYEMWAELQAEGTEALVDKRWGSAPRKRTTKREAAVLRAKALNPQRGDTDLAEEFEMDRSTVYRLLKEHELQDLHRVLDSGEASEGENPSPQAEACGGEKGGSKSSPVSRPSS